MAENAENKGTVSCPVCGAGVRKRTSPDGKKVTGIYCDNFRWEQGVNTGSCEFQLFFNQDKTRFGRDLTIADAKKLIAGESVVSPTGNKMSLDPKKESGFFTKIEYAAKAEDAFL